ncbi:MAG: phosphotransferase [Candidatus Acidiferrales bacterium]
MESPREAADTYRLIVTRRNASEILLLPMGAGWVLPQVEVLPQRRLAEQLTAEVKRAWGLETDCLLGPSARMGDANEEVRCVLMECVQHNGKPPAGAYWMQSSVATRCCDSPDAGAISQSLTQIDSCLKSRNAGPFARPGWLRDLLRWAQEQVAPRGVRLSGRFQQLNASPTFSLLRLETGDGAIWFKATGEPNAHELSVTLALTQHFPRHLPQILGVRHDWNGWLSAEAAGTPLDEIADISAWERAAEELATLQIESIQEVNELLENAPLKDLRLPKLAERIEPFLARMTELMAAQEKPTPAPLARSELATLAQGLKESLALLGSFALPDSLGHLDFNPGNILASEDHCVFLDWAEACVTNPLVTFEYLGEHMTRSGAEKPGARERLAAVYLRPWISFCTPDNLRRALAVAPLIAVFAYATANDSWRSPDLMHDPQRAGYFRSLTRRMYREAIQAAQRSELCLS